MTTRYWVIQPDGHQVQHSADLPVEPDYEDLLPILHTHLADGKAERVLVKWQDKRVDMFVDEDGLRKNLPRNDIATAVYRANFLRNHPTDNPEALSFIRGTAILFERRVWF